MLRGIQMKMVNQICQQNIIVVIIFLLHSLLTVLIMSCGGAVHQV